MPDGFIAYAPPFCATLSALRPRSQTHRPRRWRRTTTSRGSLTGFTARRAGRPPSRATTCERCRRTPGSDQRPRFAFTLAPPVEGKPFLGDAAWPNAGNP